MAAEIAIFADPGHEFQLDEVGLGEVVEPYGESFTKGEAVRIFGRNIGSSTLRDFAVEMAGPGAEKVQLAIDTEDGPGVWADAGQSIYLADYLGKDDDFSFWARAVFTFDDHEGTYHFDFHFRGVAIG